MSQTNRKSNGLEALLSRAKPGAATATTKKQFRYSGIQTRLTGLILITTIPLLIGVTFFISSLAKSRFEVNANEDLRQNNDALATNLSTWLEQNVLSLQEMVLLPNIVQMEGDQQRPVLQAVAKVHPYMYLVSTTDLKGINVARNDDAKLADYSDRIWFKNAKAGAPITFQSLIGKTSEKPALVVSTPILNNNGEIVGVGMFAADLTDLSEQTRVRKFGQSGYTYIVDADNMVLAHPDPAFTDKELKDLSVYPPVVAMRQGQTGLTPFTDENGMRWRAYITTLDNGWGIITQQQETEILTPVRQFQSVSTILIAVAAILMFALAWFAIRRTLQPIGELTEAVSAIAAGDLNRVVKVKNRDEIGLLASTFNRMTAQLREFIGTLEGRVAERTQSLELASEVGRSVSQVRALDVMLKDAAELIRARFDLYYVQVYLTNPSQTALILQSGTGSVGEQLISRGHQLPLDISSINGRAAVEKRSVVIADTITNSAIATSAAARLYMFTHTKQSEQTTPNTDSSSTFRPNPLLPDTRSEMAVPLMVGEKVVGVLDLQSNQTGALSQDTLPAFEALAGQLAIAIQNANLLEESKQARAEVESQARRQTRVNWVDYLDAIHKPEESGFVFEHNKVTPMTQAEQSQSQINVNALTAPIAVTGESLGNLVVEMEGQSPIARVDELINTVARQVAQQIESLRLLDSAERYRAEAEQASRRLTREGWKDYTDESGSLSYIYDLKEVRPLNQYESQQIDGSALKLSIKVRDEVVGKLVIQGVGTDDSESLDLANAVAERLGAHIENLRLVEQTQNTLVLNEKLYAASRAITATHDEMETASELVKHIDHTNFDRIVAAMKISDDPVTAQVVAVWDRNSMEDRFFGNCFTDQQIPLISQMRWDEAMLVNDFNNAPHIDPVTKKTFNALGVKSAAIVPIASGGNLMGWVLLETTRALTQFSAENVQPYLSLAGQAATVIQGQRLLAQSQQQAERESTLNLISQKIQSATTVEAVLQIAARELGHALGAPMTIAQLSMKDKK